MQAAANTPSPPLPPWLLHDPIRGRFHAIGEIAFTVLSQWESVPPEAFIARLNHSNPDLDFDEVELQELTEFLLAEKLLDQDERVPAYRNVCSPAFLKRFLFWG